MVICLDKIIVSRNETIIIGGNVSKEDLKRFLKSEILDFAGSVFKGFSLKSARQAPAATAWEKKKEVS